MFLQVATKFATIRNVSSSSQPIRLASEDKLAALRRIDKSRPWNCLDDRLYCTICKHEISGRQIEAVGGTNGRRALHLNAPRPVVFPPRLTGSRVKSDTVREIEHLLGLFISS